MKTTTKALAAATLLLPLSALAHNYTYLEGGYVHRDYGPTDDGGFRIAGSGSVHDRFAVIGEYSDVGDVDQITAGLLFHTPLNNQIDLNLGVTFEHVDVGYTDDSGYGLRAGLRWQLMERLELNPEVRFTDVVNSEDTSLRLAGLYGFTPELDLQAALQGGDDDRVEVGLRYNFGPRLTGR